MKRFLVRVGLLLVVLVVVALVGVNLFMGSIIKKGVETVGPAVTKVDVKLDDASLGILSGSGKLKGLLIGNPEGFKTPSAIRVGSMEVSMVPRSVFSDKVIIHSIRVLAPEVTFEGGLQGNNLSKLLDNIRGSSGNGTSGGNKQSGAAGRKIQVDDLVVAGGKIDLSVGLLAGAAASVPLPDIHMADLGQGPEGITAAELSEKLLRTILESATQAAAGGLGSIGKGLGGAAQAGGTGAVQQVEKAAKGIGDLFKRK